MNADDLMQGWIFKFYFVAHTRGKTLTPRPEETVIYHGYDTSPQKLKQAMRDGVKTGRSLIKNTRNSMFASLEMSLMIVQIVMRKKVTVQVMRMMKHLT